MQQLPIPISFLVDGEGRLTVVYKGKVDIDQLLHDTRRPPDQLVKRWHDAACFSGRFIDHPGLMSTLQRMEAVTLNQLGMMYSRAQRYHDALPPLRAALAAQPDFGLAHYEYAKTLQAFGKYDEAVKHYQTALDASVPDPVKVYMDFGNMHARRGNNVEAAECFKKLLDVDPHSVPGHINYGVMMTALNNYPLAEAHFRKALDIDSNSQRARAGLEQVQALVRAKRQ